MSVLRNRVFEMAKDSGYDNVVYGGKWNGYNVYEPYTKGDGKCVGFPQVMLVRGNSIRFSEPAESRSYLRAKYPD